MENAQEIGFDIESLIYQYVLDNSRIYFVDNGIGYTQYWGSGSFHSELEMEGALDCNNPKFLVPDISEQIEKDGSGIISKEDISEKIMLSSRNIRPLKYKYSVIKDILDEENTRQVEVKITIQ